MELRLKQSAEAFLHAFASWGVSLGFIVLPIYFAHEIDGYLMYMTWIEIAIDAALILLVMMALAACLGIFSALLSLCLPQRATSVPVSINLALSLAVAAFFLLRGLKQWLEAISGIRLSVGNWKFSIALALLATLLLLWQTGHSTRLRLAARALPRSIGWIVAISLTAIALIAASDLHIAHYGDQNLPQIAPVKQRPNIILISIDTLSAIDLSVYNYALNTSPQLKLFASNSIVFSNVHADSNFTAPSITSLLTGRSVSDHRVYQLYAHLRGKAVNENIANILEGSGYGTAAFVSSHWAHPFHLNISGFQFIAKPQTLGLERDILSALLRVKDANLISTTNNLLAIFEPLLNIAYDKRTPVPPNLTYEAAEKYLVQAQGPQFVWTHVSPPHEPYLPPAPFKEMFLNGDQFSSAADQSAVWGFYSSRQQATIDQLRLRYDEYIAYTDHALGSYLAFLKSHGYFDNSLIIITADHGQSFDHSFYGHAGPLMHESLIHVPLLMHLPGQTQRLDDNVIATLSDVAPTILNFAKLPRPDYMHGQSLFSKGSNAGFPSISMNFEESSTFTPLKRGSVAIRSGAYKYVYYFGDRPSQLFNLEQDPAETHNLAISERRRGDSLERALLERLHESAISP